MYIESSFYQLTGYRAHSNKWQVEWHPFMSLNDRPHHRFTHKRFDDSPLTEAIFSTKSKLLRPGGPDSPIELVLGILPSGASYLLMSSEQALDFTLKHRQNLPRDPWNTDDFISLSPIYFSSPKEFTAKIKTYKQRPRNKNRREHDEMTLDNSQANRGYVQTGTAAVHYRAYFEQQRTLYRLLTRELEAGKVGLAVPPWLRSVRVVSLVFGQWNVDDRSRSDRLKDPRLVEVGWTDALLPFFFEKLAGSTVHFQLQTGMKNPGSKNPYHSEIVKGNQEGLYDRLRNLLKHDANKSGIPLILLVHDEEMARVVLARAGIDVTTWSSGLSKLLPIVPAKNRCKSEPDIHNPAILPEPSVVDTQKLVKTSMETSPGSNVPQSAKVLRMQSETKTCAGDDSLLQLRMWLSMAQDLAIDEQRAERLSRQPDCAYVLSSPPDAQQGQADVEANPDDFDPNDEPSAPLAPNIVDDSSDDDW